MKKLEKLLRQGDTEERCGLILKGNKILELDNVAEDKVKGFEIPPEALVEHEDNLIGTWHTHPGETGNLSDRDRIGFCNWPKLKHFIIGTDGVSEYYVEDGIVFNAN